MMPAVNSPHATLTLSLKFDLFIKEHCDLSPAFSGCSTLLIKPASELATGTLPLIKTTQAFDSSIIIFHWIV